MSKSNSHFPGTSSINVYGGGFSVFHSVGPLGYTLERCQNISLIEGVSAGALLTAILISVDFDINKLIAIGLEIEKMGPKAIFKSTLPGNMPHYFGSNLYDNDGVKNLIRRYVNVQKIIDWEGEYIAVAHNESLGINVPFSNKDERLRKNPELLNLWILASMSLGMILPEVEINGEIYSDGLTCSIAASIERRIDNIFLLVNHRLDGSDLLIKNQKWLKKPIATLRRSVRQSIVKDIKYALDKGYVLIERNPSRHFTDIETNKKNIIKNIVRDTIDAINPLNPESITERAITQRRVLVFTPVESVPTLCTDAFHYSDIKTAIDYSIQETKDFDKTTQEL